MRLPIRVSEESREPIYHQIETQIKALIISGQLPYNTPLPSIRKLANDLACSAITTRRAYQDLENQGFIKTIQGKGTFVRQIEPNDKEQVKQQIISVALERVIEQAESLGYSIEELQQLLLDTLQAKRLKGESKNA